MEYPIEAIELPSPAGYSPLRQPQSVRRTSSIDMTWPEGHLKPIAFHGIARDIFTDDTEKAPLIIHEDEMTATISLDRKVLAISSAPERQNIQKLIGAYGGGHLRKILNATLQEEHSSGSPLYLLIDDISGASLIAPWAWSQWPGYENPQEHIQDVDTLLASMKNVCIGFRAGSSAHENATTPQHHRSSPVLPLPHPEDPQGWHELKLHDKVSMRRARRIDVWLDNEIFIDATFQDSASTPEGNRVAVHEYTLKVTAHPETLTIQEITATPHILPFPECPSAIRNMSRLIGKPVQELRTIVLEELPQVHGCTHLNDALRSLAETPSLIKALKENSQ